MNHHSLPQTASSGKTLEACPHCDLLYFRHTESPTRRQRCPRCASLLRQPVRGSIGKAAALSLTGLILYLPAVTQPLVTFTVMGLESSGNVIDSILVLLEQGYYFVSLCMLLVCLLFPLLKLSLLFLVSLSLLLKLRLPHAATFFKVYGRLSEWGMVEVYMLGILVSVIKMSGMADIEYNPGFFCFVALVLITIGASAVVDDALFWRQIAGGSDREQEDRPPEPSGRNVAVSARQTGLIGCLHCGHLVRRVNPGPDRVLRCPRCRSILHSRKPDSLGRTWALVLSAAILFFPANLYPIMKVIFLGSGEDSTILDGISYFFSSGEYLIGAVILTASVLVPLFKITGILIILVSIQFRRCNWLRHKTIMFRFIEFIGRWSFLDIFVIALLAATVRFGELTTIEADPAAPYFTAVVLATMFAALAFDPRLLWDICEPTSPERTQS